MSVVPNLVSRGGASRLGVVAAAAAAAAASPVATTTSFAFIHGHENPIPVQRDTREGRVVFFRADQVPDPGRDYGTGSSSSPVFHDPCAGAGLRLRHVLRPEQAAAHEPTATFEARGPIATAEVPAATEARGPEIIVDPQPIAEGEAVTMPSWLWRTFIESMCLSSDAARFLWKHRGTIVLVVGTTAAVVGIAAIALPAVVLPALGTAAAFLSKAALALGAVATAHPIAGEHCHNFFQLASLNFHH